MAYHSILVSATIGVASLPKLCDILKKQDMYRFKTIEDKSTPYKNLIYKIIISCQSKFKYL